MTPPASGDEPVSSAPNDRCARDPNGARGLPWIGPRKRRQPKRFSSLDVLMATSAAAWRLAEWHHRHGVHGRLCIGEAPLDDSALVKIAEAHDGDLIIGLAPE